MDANSLDYIRFSTQSYSTISREYHLSTDALISAVFSTALLNAVGTDIPNQQIIECSNVTRSVLMYGLII